MQNEADTINAYLDGLVRRMLHYFPNHHDRAYLVIYLRNYFWGIPRNDQRLRPVLTFCDVHVPDDLIRELMGVSYARQKAFIATVDQVHQETILHASEPEILHSESDLSSAAGSGRGALEGGTGFGQVGDGTDDSNSEVAKAIPRELRNCAAFPPGNDQDTDNTAVVHSRRVTNALGMSGMCPQRLWLPNLGRWLWSSRLPKPEPVPAPHPHGAMDEEASPET
jgi:hypothetical protein